MGQLRSAAQALLLRTPEPAQALSDLDSFARRLPSAKCTTVLCAVIDVSSSAVRYSSAGHPPRCSSTEPVGGCSTGAVGAAGGHRDGLVPPASRGQAASGRDASALHRRADRAQARVDERGNRTGIDSTEPLPPPPPDYVADHLMTDLAPPSGFDDDVAVLLYRHPPSSLSVRSPARPTSLALIRERLRRWLPSAAIDADAAEDVLLAVGEAAANATEHAVPRRDASGRTHGDRAPDQSRSGADRRRRRTLARAIRFGESPRIRHRFDECSGGQRRRSRQPDMAPPWTCSRSCTREHPKTTASEDRSEERARTGASGSEMSTRRRPRARIAARNERGPERAGVEA